jgi:putative component of membrane protein insertase Oxa1/YidC/SpoIIIJ protein YidD
MSLYKCILIQILLVVFFLTIPVRYSFSQDDHLVPWSVTKNSPVIEEEVKKDKSDPYALKASPYISIFWHMKLMKLTYSKSEGTCTFIPPCSEYTKQAILKHGLLIGLVMGFERIMRYHSDYATYDLVKTKSGYKFFDTLGMNDFWFK